MRRRVKSGHEKRPHHERHVSAEAAEGICYCQDMFGVHSQLVADYFTPTPLAGGLYLSIVSLGRSHSPCKFDDIDINPEVIVQARAPLEIFDRLTQLAQTRRVGEINDENLPGASLGSWTICDAAQCGPGDD